MRLSALCAALLTAVAVASPAVPALAAGDDVTWTVRTASNSFGADRTSYSYTIDPGATVSDAIVIANHGDEPVALEVYAADGYTSSEGQLSLLVQDDPSHALGTWIAAESGTVELAAGETATVPFTIAIPEDATPGDYAGGIITSLTVPDESAGVNVDRRLGIRVDLRVGGQLAPSLAVEDAAVSWNGGLNPFAGGDATITYTLHNTGNAALDAQPTARVAGLFGILGMDASAAEVPELLPGESWTQTVTVPGVPPLFALLASVTVTPLVVDASGSTSPLAEISATAVGIAVPWTALGLLALAVAAALLLRRRSLGKQAATDELVQARVSAAVEQALADGRAKVAQD